MEIKLAKIVEWDNKFSITVPIKENEKSDWELITKKIYQVLNKDGIYAPIIVEDVCSDFGVYKANLYIESCACYIGFTIWIVGTSD